VDHDSPYYAELSGYLKDMVIELPGLQDKQTGHWYQLPVRNTDPHNFIESSCTAMFAYGISAALRLGVVKGDSYRQSADLAYKGLRQYSITPIGKKYLTTKNVCKGTCIGDKEYYFKRSVQNGKPYGIGMFILFGFSYEYDHGRRDIDE
jgi:unsaturated rhamnogalacturonyl hydrolase